MFTRLIDWLKGVPWNDEKVVVCCQCQQPALIFNKRGRGVHITFVEGRGVKIIEKVDIALQEVMWLSNPGKVCHSTCVFE